MSLEWLLHNTIAIRQGYGQEIKMLWGLTDHRAQIKVMPDLKPFTAFLRP